MEAIWSFFIKKKSFSILLIIAIILFGLFSLISIPKESAPEVQVPIGVVTTVFPGASAIDIEKLITNKIEERLANNLDELNNLTSSSQEGVSSIIAEFNANADIDEAIDSLKEEVDAVKRELPSEAEDPFVSEINFVDQPIMLVSISSDLPIIEFIELADLVERELESVSGVSRVEQSGLRDREVQVVLHKEALDQFGVSVLEVSSAISRANSSLPVGSIELDGILYTVRFEGDIEDPKEIGDISVGTRGGEPIYVRDVAFVSDGLKEPSSFARVSIDGNPSEQALSLSIFKKGGGDITRISRDLEAKIAELESGILADASVLISFDTGEYVRTDLRNLSFTAFQTVALVFIILFLALGLRPAIVAALAIPMSFLMAFIGLNASGNTINFVSLFSLILAVGILVDSAIVVSEGMFARIIETHERKRSALETIKEFHWPLTSGTMTTIAVFAPLFLVSGVTGQFIASIPFTIIFVLLASLFVALAVIPLLASKILKKQGPGKFAMKQDAMTKRIEGWYKNKLESFLGNKRKEKIFFLLVTVLFIGSFVLPGVGIVKVIFFPEEDQEFVYVELEKERGTTLSETDISIRAVEELLLEVDDIESFVTTVGSASFFSEGGSGEYLANITILLRDDRDSTSQEIVNSLRNKLGVIPNVKLRVNQPTNGPPTGAPILIKFLGEDIGELREAIAKAEDLLGDIPGTVDVDSSASGDGVDFVIRIDRAKASLVGVDASTVAATLRTAVNGSTATTLKTGNGEDIDVGVRLALNPEYRDPYDTDRTTIDAVRYIEIPTRDGNTVLLASLIDTSIEESSSIIRHDDRKRVMSVSSDITEETTVRDVVKEFNERVAELDLPSDIEISIGGETEDVDQSFQDMLLSLIVGMVLVLSILVLQFNSFRQAFIIIAIVPLSLIGIFAGLAITGLPISFPSIMGFIALSGIVVNNSIILIDRINKNRIERPWASEREIVIDGAVSRLRPILLTTLTTVIGIFPLTYASALWAPLAWSIMFGLSFAVFVTLLLVPILCNRFPTKLE